MALPSKINSSTAQTTIKIDNALQ